MAPLELVDELRHGKPTGDKVVMSTLEDIREQLVQLTAVSFRLGGIGIKRKGKRPCLKIPQNPESIRHARRAIEDLNAEEQDCKREAELRSGSETSQAVGWNG